MTKISGSSQTFFPPLKEGKSTAGHYQPCFPPPWLLQSGTLAAKAFPPSETPPLPTHLQGNKSMESFKQVSNNFFKFGLFLPLRYNPLWCFPSRPQCLFLCRYSSHKALCQTMVSSAGASKEKGRSETIIMLLEPNTAKQEVPWFNINNHFLWVEKQHFTGYSSVNEQTP